MESPFRSSSHRQIAFCVSTLLFVFIGGCGRSIQKIKLTDSINKNIISNSLYVPMGVTEIQAFLDSQPGILKNYRERVYEQIFTGAEIIDAAANDSRMGILNPRILLVLIELRRQALTNSKLTTEEARNVFNIPQAKLEELGSKSSGVPAWPYAGPPEANTLLGQLMYVAETIRQAPTTSTAAFRDGTSIALAPGINEETMRIELVLAQLAESQDQWLYWISDASGSFADIYTKWFGDPIRPAAPPSDPDAPAAFVNQPHRYSKIYYDWFGTAELQGFLISEHIACDAEIDPLCDRDYDSALFIAQDADKKIIDFLSSVSEVDASGNRRLRIGCLEKEQNKIHYFNRSDVDTIEQDITGSEYARLAASSKKQPVHMRVTRLIFTGGGGASECFTHFLYFKVK